MKSTLSQWPEISIIWFLLEARDQDCQVWPSKLETSYSIQADQSSLSRQCIKTLRCYTPNKFPETAVHPLLIRLRHRAYFKLWFNDSRQLLASILLPTPARSVHEVLNLSRRCCLRVSYERYLFLAQIYK